MMVNRQMRWLVVTVALACLAACDANGDDSPGDSPQSGSSSGGARDLPRLLLEPAGEHGDLPAGMAFVSDKLHVNHAGCFALGRNLLRAPFGSTVLPDGSGVDLPGIGVVKVGETVTGGGAYGEYATLSDVPDPMKGCIAGRPPFWYVILNGPDS